MNQDTGQPHSNVMGSNYAMDWSAANVPPMPSGIMDPSNDDVDQSVDEDFSEYLTDVKEFEPHFQMEDPSKLSSNPFSSNDIMMKRKISHSVAFFEQTQAFNNAANPEGKSPRSQHLESMKFVELNYDQKVDFEINTTVQKLDVTQLVDEDQKLASRLQSFAALLKYEYECSHSYYLLRNQDAVIQLCLDHDGSLTNCYTSWFGSQLRSNDKLKALILQNNWVQLVKTFHNMNCLIPSSIPMHERVNCLNGLLILEHDLSLLLSEGSMAAFIYGQERTDVYRARTDVTPFTIALLWKPDAILAIPDVTENEMVHSTATVAYLSVVYSEYMTLFPTSSCLDSKLNWLDLTSDIGIHTPGKFALTFSRSIIIRLPMLKDLVKIDGVAVYSERPVNWISETSALLGLEKGIGFTSSENGNCFSHRYFVKRSLTNKNEDCLVKQITFTSPHAILAILTKIRQQLNLISLIEELNSVFKESGKLPYSERCIISIDSDSATGLSLLVNFNSVQHGIVYIWSTSGGFDIKVSFKNDHAGVVGSETDKWRRLLNESRSIVKLIHQVIVDISAAQSTQQGNSVRKHTPFSYSSYLIRTRRAKHLRRQGDEMCAYAGVFRSRVLVRSLRARRLATCAISSKMRARYETPLLSISSKTATFIPMTSVAMRTAVWKRRAKKIKEKMSISKKPSILAKKVRKVQSTTTKQQTSIEKKVLIYHIANQRLMKLKTKIRRFDEESRGKGAMISWRTLCNAKSAIERQFHKNRTFAVQTEKSDETDYQPTEFNLDEYVSMEGSENQMPAMFSRSNLLSAPPSHAMEKFDSQRRADSGKTPSLEQLMGYTDPQQYLNMDQSGLAARRMGRNWPSSSAYGGMEEEEENISSEDEETDPPPPPKTGAMNTSQQRSRLLELREKRQKITNQMVQERQKAVEQQQQEFAQRHQMQIRPGRLLMNSSSTSSLPPSEQSTPFQPEAGDPLSAEKMRNYMIKTEGVTFDMEGAPLLNKEMSMKGKRSLPPKRRSSSSSSSCSSSSSSSSGSSTVQKNRTAKRSNTNGKGNRRTADDAAAPQLIPEHSTFGDSGSMESAPTLEPVQMYHNDFPPSRRLSIYGAEEASSESSTSDDESSTSSSNPNSPPPALPSTNESDGMQDEESRQSCRSSSSLPPPPILAIAEPSVRLGIRKDESRNGGTSRKNSTAAPLSPSLDLIDARRRERHESEKSRSKDSSKSEKKAKGSEKKEKEKSKEKDKAKKEKEKKERKEEKLRIKGAEKVIKPDPDAVELKRKKETKDAQPSTSKAIASKPAATLKVKDTKPKDAMRVREIVKEMRSKRKETKLSIKEISPPPLQQNAPLRKRSPHPSTSGRKKDEVVPAKKAKRTDPDFKPAVEKVKKRSEDPTRLKRTTTPSIGDERKRKRKGDADDEHEPEEKKKAAGFPDLPEFGGRAAAIGTLKNFRIPKVSDTDAAKAAENKKEKEEKEREEKEEKEREEKEAKEKEIAAAEKEKDKEKERERNVERDKYGNPIAQHKIRGDRTSHGRWDRERERRDYYGGANERRDREYYERRDAGGFDREHFPMPGRGMAPHRGRGGYQGPPRGYGADFDMAPNTSAYPVARRGRGGGGKPGARGPQGGEFEDPYVSDHRGTRGASFAARKPMMGSPPHKYRGSQRPGMYGRDGGNWMGYPGQPAAPLPLSGFPPTGAPTFFNNQSFNVPPTLDRFDRDYRDNYDGGPSGAAEQMPEMAVGSDSSPSEGLQIDEGV